MNVNRGQTSFTEEEQAGLRAELDRYKNYYQRSWADLSKETGIAAGTLQPWFKGNYQGDNNRIAALVTRFFLAIGDRQRLEIEAPLIPGFIPTPTSRRIHSQLRWAQRGRMTLSLGAPGVGKTAALRQFVAITPNVFLTTVTEASKTPTALLRLIMKGVGKKHEGVGLSRFALFDTLCDRLNGAQALILVDEAQHAQDDALDLLRGLHDETGCGVALAGNTAVFTRIKGVTRQTDFAQLHSRISQVAFYEKPDEGDVNMVLDAWEVADGKQREFLKLLAGQPGCLRAITQVLEQATLVARQEDEPRNLSHLKHAWQLHGRPSGLVRS